MKRFVLFSALIGFLFLGSMTAFAQTAVTISSPSDGATVSGPVEVCLQAWGVQFEPAKKGVNEGKGHNHLLIDTPLPSNLGNPIAKDAQHVHMGDGSSCKTLKLSPGKHTIRSLFAKGNHVPYNPPMSDMITITVK